MAQLLRRTTNPSRLKTPATHNKPITSKKMSIEEKNTTTHESSLSGDRHHSSLGTSLEHKEMVSFENVKADDDSLQVLASTTEGIVIGKDVILQKRATQFLGKISGETLQHLSSDRSKVLLQMKDGGKLSDSHRYSERYGGGNVLGTLKPKD